MKIKKFRYGIFCLFVLLIIISGGVIHAIKFSRTHVSLYIGQTYQLKIKNINGKSISWGIKNKKIASVNNKGKIKAKKKGNTKVVAKIGKRKLYCIVKVKKATLKLNKTKLQMKTGEAFQLNVKNFKKGIKWKSSNSDIAIVTNDGIVVAIGEGTVQISAKIYGGIAKCIVNIQNNMEVATEIPTQATTTTEGSILLTPSMPVNMETIQPTTNVIVSNIPMVINTPATSSALPVVTEIPSDEIVVTPIVTEIPANVESNIPIILPYDSRTEEINNATIAIPSSWNKSVDKTTIGYTAYFPISFSNSINNKSGVLFGMWEATSDMELSSVIDLYNYVSKKLEEQKQLFLNNGNVVQTDLFYKVVGETVCVVSKYNITFGEKSNVMQIYNFLENGYLIEVEVGDVGDSVEPNVYDVAENIIKTVTILK